MLGGLGGAAICHGSLIPFTPSENSPPLQSPFSNLGNIRDEWVGFSDAYFRL